jgi:hypothetical protein
MKLNRRMLRKIILQEINHLTESSASFYKGNQKAELMSAEEATVYEAIGNLYNGNIEYDTVTKEYLLDPEPENRDPVISALPDFAKKSLVSGDITRIYIPGLIG